MSIKTFGMWKIVILSVIVFTLILTEAAPKADHAENANDDRKWKCNEICSSTGAEAHFDEETLVCKCVVVANVDDAEMALIKENIQLLNSHTEPNIEPSVTMNSRSRRHLSQNSDNIISNKDTIIHDPAVGQAILVRLPRQKSSAGFQEITPLKPPLITPLNPSQILPHAVVLPQNPRIPQIPAIVVPPNVVPVYPQNPGIQKHLERIRARIQELANRSNARNAQVNLETIRNHLKELRDRVNIGNINTQDQRAARARAYQDKLERERQRIQQLHALRPAGGGLFAQGRAGGGLFAQGRAGGVVGAAAAVVTSANTITTALPPTENASDKLNPKNPPNSVITQPKDLVDEE